MADYSALRNKLIATLKDRATHDVVILVTVPGAAPDPSKPWRTNPSSYDQHPCKAVVSSVRMPTGEAVGTMPKDCIVPGDIAIFPDDSMRVLHDGDEYKIDAVQEFNVNDLAVGYKLRICAYAAA